MSDTVIVGLCEIWRQSAHEMQAGTEDKTSIMIREEARRLKRVDIEKELVTGADEEVDGGKDEGEGNEEDEDEKGRNEENRSEMVLETEIEVNTDLMSSKFRRWEIFAAFKD
jgi:hypothetical protein